MKKLTVLAILILSFQAFALTPPFVVEDDGATQTSIEKIVLKIQPGTILILGELHNNPDHHENQMTIVEALIKHGLQVNLGMEFLNYTDQYEIYKYETGLLLKDEFLKNIDWKTPETFEFYSPMVDAVHDNGGSLIGLNIPRPITSKIAQNGMDSLTISERVLLPTHILYGNEFYFDRFYDAVGGKHVPDDKLENYFWAQSVWDDVMSWKALEFMERNPLTVLVITVGDFHVAYGGGLTEIIKRKGFQNVKSISQTLKGDLNDADLINEITPHPTYGPRADWVWVTE